MIKIDAPLDSVPFKRVAGNFHKYNDPRYRDFKDALGYYALQAMQGRNPFSGAVIMLEFVYRKINPISKRFGDADNHIKSAMDALSGICYKDDSQIVISIPVKLFGEPKIIIELAEIDWILN